MLEILLELFFKQVSFLASALYTQPVFIGLAISLYGSVSYNIELDDIKKFVLTCLSFAFCGLLAVYTEPILLYINFYIQGLNPRVPNIFEKGVMAYTACAISHCIGLFFLLLLYVKINSLHQYKRNKKFFLILYLLLTLSTIFFFGSILLKSWPFAQLPEGICRWNLLTLLLQKSLHQYVNSLIPAGICTFLYSLYVLKQKHINCKNDDNNRCHARKIFRFCNVCCILGIAPKSFVALGYLISCFINGNVVYYSTAMFGESFFLLCSLICFSVLLIPRLSESCSLQIFAVIVYLIVWNWNIIFALSRNLRTL